jgi:hypothetical protein
MEFSNGEMFFLSTCTILFTIGVVSVFALGGGKEEEE